ncbi:hypothetical protein L9G16_13305 [Shewanella sp. A25]|nr:hypothetical protein [Shewanella shenzhenensis]
MNTAKPSFFTLLNAESALLEVKFHAKKLLKSCLANDPESLAKVGAYCKKVGIEPSELQLKHCQLLLSRQIGFNDFNHCQRVLTASTSDKMSNDNFDEGLGEKLCLDLGGLFHFRRCDTLLNHWFTDLTEAQAFSATDPKLLLLPFKRQFFVVNRDDYLGLLEIQGLTAEPPSNNEAFYAQLALELVKYKLKAV